MNDFGNLLYTLRKQKGLTQQELADELGVTNKAVSKWETGEAFPETGLVLPLADLLGVTADDLLRGKYAPRSPSRETQTVSKSEEKTKNEAPMSDNDMQKSANDQSEKDAWKARKTALGILSISLIVLGAVLCMPAPILFAIAASAGDGMNFSIIMVGLLVATVILGFLLLGAGIDVLLYALLTGRYAFRDVEDAAYPMRFKRFRRLVIGGTSAIFFSVPFLFPAFAVVRALPLLVLFALFLCLGVFLILYGTVAWHKFSDPLLKR